MIYLLVDKDNFNSLPALKQVRGAIRSPKTSTMERYAKIVTQLTFNCLKSTIERSEKRVKYVQS